MKEHGFVATVFLPLEGIGKTSYWDEKFNRQAVAPLLSLAQIKEMQRYGISFGSHTMSHPFLARFPPEEAECQIRESRRRLEELLDQKISVFSYPYGSYNDAVKEMVRQAGYQGAVTVRQGVNVARNDHFTLLRLRVRNNADDLARLLGGKD